MTYGVGQSSIPAKPLRNYCRCPRRQQTRLCASLIRQSSITLALLAPGPVLRTIKPAALPTVTAVATFSLWVPVSLCFFGFTTSAMVVIIININTFARGLKISKLSALVTLCLDHNRFCGPIPRGISGMKALNELRLDHNELTGKLPVGDG